MMKKMFFLLMMGLIASVASADYNETFDSFTPLGVLEAQPAPISWEAASLVNVVVEGSGRALKTTSLTDKTFRHDATGVIFGLALDKDGIEYGFDFKEDYSTAVNMRMYLRDKRTAIYSPSFGLAAGVMRIRTNGEGGADYIGTNFASSDIYGAGTVEDPGYWVKGDWLRFKIILRGTAFDTATVKVYNLSRGGLEIPTGLNNISLGVNPKYHATWTGFNFRGGTTATYVDNAYVMDWVNTAVEAENPNPANGEYPIGVNNITLSWLPGGGANSHKVYFGTDAGALNFVTETTNLSYLLPYTLEKGVTYYWRIDEVVGATTYEGLVWNFTTILDPLNLPRRMAYEGFDYVPYVALKASGNGYGGFGWATGWERVLGEDCYVTIGAGSLNPAMVYPYGTVGNKIQHTNAAANGNDAMRKLEYPIDLRADQDYYISYLAMGDSDAFNAVNLALYENKTVSGFGVNMLYTGYPNVTTPTAYIRDFDGNWLTHPIAGWASDVVSLVVIKIEAHATGNDIVSVCLFDALNPLPMAEPTVWQQSISADKDTVYSWLQFSGRADGYDQWQVDEVHVGTGWGTVTGQVEACGDLGTIMSWDLNADCQVNLVDFAKLATDWLRCTNPGGIGCENLTESPDLITVIDPSALVVNEVGSTVTVDGDLSEWDGPWYNVRFTSGFNAGLAADVTEAKISLQWNPTSPQVVYMALKVTDTAHNFTNAPTVWDSGDNIEVRFSVNDTSTNTTWYSSETYDVAQYYQLFRKASGGSFCTLGPVGFASTDDPATGDIDVAYATSVVGNEIIYEMALPTYSLFNINTHSGTKLSLTDGKIIAVDLQINSVSTAGAGGLFADQSSVPSAWFKFTVKANSSLSLGDWGFFDADIDLNGEVGLTDLRTIATKWLSCTDPEIVGCDQPWAP